MPFVHIDWFEGRSDEQKVVGAMPKRRLEAELEPALA